MMIRLLSVVALFLVVAALPRVAVAEEDEIAVRLQQLEAQTQALQIRDYQRV